MSARSILTASAPIIFVLLWSTGFIASKAGAPYADPFTFLAIRFAIVTGLFVLLALVLGSPWPGRRVAIHSMIVGVLTHGIYLGGVFWAIDNGMPAGVSALIVGLQPLATALIAWPLLGDRPKPRLLIALGVGLAGVAMVLAPGLQSLGSGIDAATIFASLLATIGISLGTIHQKRHVADANLVTGGVYQYFAGTIFVFLLALAFEPRQIVWSAEFVTALVYLIFVLSIGAVLLLMVLIRHGAISKVATLFYLVPAFSAIEGAILFGERLNGLQIAGLIVTAIAVAVAMRPAPDQPSAGTTRARAER